MAEGGGDARDCRGRGRRGDACIGRCGGGSWHGLPADIDQYILKGQRGVDLP